MHCQRQRERRRPHDVVRDRELTGNLEKFVRVICGGNATKNRDEKRVVRALYTAAAIACDLTRAQFVFEDVRDAHADARMKVESMPSEKKTAASDAGVQEGSFVTTAAPPATTAVPAPVTPQPSVQDTRPPARHTPPPR